jgi:hypothetical protein
VPSRTPTTFKAAKMIGRCEPRSPPCSSLSFSSYYIYSPHGDGVAAQVSRRLCQRIKQSDSVWLPRYVGPVCRAASRDPRLWALFAADAVLVPVPGSMPCGGAPWAASTLALALREVGLAPAVWFGLRRLAAVRKSATAPSHARPTVGEHFGSFLVMPPPGTIGRIVLIDDVITKGRTLLAAAARMQAAFPHADVRAFALIRTVGFRQRVDNIIEPCAGVVRWAGGDARREP